MLDHIIDDVVHLACIWHGITTKSTHELWCDHDKTEGLSANCVTRYPPAVIALFRWRSGASEKLVEISYAPITLRTMPIEKQEQRVFLGIGRIITRRQVFQVSMTITIDDDTSLSHQYTLSTYTLGLPSK